MTCAGVYVCVCVWGGGGWVGVGGAGKATVIQKTTHFPRY